MWQWDSYAFGETAPYLPTGSSGAMPTVNLRYPGQYFDSESGNHYNWHRYYETSTGQYTASDPIGLDGGVNTYSYVSSNPLLEFDLMGLAGSRNGGPYHPPLNVKTKCRMSDTCSQIKGKIWLLKRMIDSHQGWDWKNPSPSGGGRHTQEIADLWTQYANCQSLYSRKCSAPARCESCRKVTTAITAAGITYFAYRCARMLPSLFPPLWPTIPANLVAP